MKIFSDFHIHSRYSRATSKDITIGNLVKYARIKGLNLIGTGDFTHPAWFRELGENLTDEGTGILRDGSGFNFVLQTEVSSIYSQDRKVRRVHNIILAPGFEVAAQINEYLGKKGRLDADGRPILGLPCPELVENLMSISKEIMVIPAHAWTPWFSVFGSNSGFNTIAECFLDQANHIHALETGLSSDPAMNWRLSKLDSYALVSNSDSHSFWPWRIGREANVMEFPELTYRSFTAAIKDKDPKTFLYTIEVDPSYGKYHFDGHRNCSVVLDPKESRKIRGICPKCGRPLTIGVLNRVEELADRPEGFVPQNPIPFKSVIPLSEIIASFIGANQPYSKKVWTEYTKLVEGVGSEFAVLLDAPFEQLRKFVDEKIAKAIVDVRFGRIKIVPGYDGEYGYPDFGDAGKRSGSVKTATPGDKQKSLFDFGSGKSSGLQQ
jgi:uncharacterized protein (TIGR00375 family)